MLEKNDKNFYSRQETFVDENSQIEIADAVKVGIRISFDLLNGQIILTETAFANADAFANGAIAIPASERTHIIAGEQFDEVFKNDASFSKTFKSLFKDADAEFKRVEAERAETDDKARAERLKLLTAEIEKAGGKVTFAD